MNNQEKAKVLEAVKNQYTEHIHMFENGYWTSPSGLCTAANFLAASKELTFEEHDWFLELLTDQFKNGDANRLVNEFVWPTDDYQSRFDWLNKKIKLYSL